MQGVHDGEEKHHVKLSNDIVDYETTEISELPSSSTENGESAAIASTHGSSTLQAFCVNEKTASLNQANAPEQAYTQDVTAEDGNKALPGTAHPSAGIEKDRSAAAVNVPIPNPTVPRDEAYGNGNDKEDASTQAEVDPASSPYPEGGLRAWLVVFGSFSGMTASFGVLNMSGTFQAYLSTHQLANESPSNIGWIFSLYAFLTFFCGVQIGPVFDAKGPRWLVAAGSVFLFAGMMGLAVCTCTGFFVFFFFFFFFFLKLSVLTALQSYGISSSHTPSSVAWQPHSYSHQPLEQSLTFSPKSVLQPPVSLQLVGQ